MKKYLLLQTYILFKLLYLLNNIIMIKTILEFFWYNVIDDQEYTEYLFHLNERNELKKTISNLKITITDLKKKDHYELYKQQLVELNRLRSNLKSAYESRDKYKQKYESTKQRLRDIIGEKAKKNYCYKK